ncbi:MAG: hypothetical protein ACXW61_01340 [Gemmatirosa sp.]
MRRSGWRNIALAFSLCVAPLACGGDPAGVGPRSPTELAGVVTLVGGLPPGAAARHVALYASVFDLEELRDPVRMVPLVPTGDAFAFQATDLPPGTYYVRACFSFGCGEHRTTAGTAIGTRIAAAQRVAVAFAL